MTMGRQKRMKGGSREIIRKEKKGNVRLCRRWRNILLRKRDAASARKVMQEHLTGPKHKIIPLL
jgi:hypothetical protein